MIAPLKRIGAYALTSGTLVMSLASSAFAQFGGEDPELEGTPGAGTDEGTIREIIVNVVNVVLNFLALIAVIVIVIAGIRLIISQGEDEAKDKAKKTIFYALIGLVIVLFARVIVGLITNILAGEVTGGVAE